MTSPPVSSALHLQAAIARYPLLHQMDNLKTAFSANQRDEHWEMVTFIMELLQMPGTGLRSCDA